MCRGKRKKEFPGWHSTSGVETSSPIGRGLWTEPGSSPSTVWVSQMWLASSNPKWSWCHLHYNNCGTTHYGYVDFRIQLGFQKIKHFKLWNMRKHGLILASTSTFIGTTSEHIRQPPVPCHIRPSFKSRSAKGIPKSSAPITTTKPRLVGKLEVCTSSFQPKKNISNKIGRM